MPVHDDTYYDSHDYLKEFQAEFDLYEYGMQEKTYVIDVEILILPPFAAGLARILRPAVVWQVEYVLTPFVIILFLVDEDVLLQRLFIPEYHLPFI